MGLPEKVKLMERRGSGIRHMERRWGILLAMPAMLGFVLFTIGPMLASFGISLTDWNIFGEFHYVGFANYREMFSNDPLFPKSMFATLYYALGSVPLTLFLAFVVASLLNQRVPGLAIFRTMFYLPVLMPSIANTVLWLWIFNPEFGLLNSALWAAGLPGSQWIYSETMAVPSLILMSSWGIGNAMVIFLAGLQGMPQHLYDAIAIDGGNAWHKFRHITIPMMTPTIFFNLVLGTIGSLQAFNEAYVMTNGGPNNATLFYVFYLYRTAFTESRMGYASALAWLLFLVILVVTVVVFSTARHWVYYEAADKA